jgi:peptidoglycan lytic transglycosylase G
MMRFIGFIFLLIAVVVGCGWLDYQHAVDQPLLIKEPLTFEIEKGDSLRKITQSLGSNGILYAPFWFQIMAIVGGNADKLKAGEYELEPGMTARGLLSTLLAGKVHHHTLTLVEGWTFRQVIAELGRHPDITATLAGKSHHEIMALIGSTHQHPEGRFFPDTYFFTKGTTDLAVLKRAYQRMQTVLDAQWSNRAEGLPLRTPYDALILASIIEKETGRANERATIAGVFTRRLGQGMPLQTDPTVIYGMGEEFDGNIRQKDLVAPTPYNTYIHTGLPPTPIAMPGAASIYAALHPNDDSSLYFVSRGDGTHVFSTTVKEHGRAVDIYQRKKKKR